MDILDSCYCCEKSQFPGSRSAISGRRYYNPAVGRFPGRDPKQEKGGLHLYGFVGNNGINRWDYLGMDGPGISSTSNTPPLQPGQVANLVAQNKLIAAWYYSKYGNYNSGGGGSFGGADPLAGVSEIAGAGDLVQETDSGYNPIADNLGIGTVYQMNSSGQWGYGTSSGANFAANTSMPTNSNLRTGQVNIGGIVNLGVVGDDPNNAGPATTGGNYQAVLVTLPDGTQEMPYSIVKTQAQATLLGVSVGAVVPIIVPPGQDPQGMVNSWTAPN